MVIQLGGTYRKRLNMKKDSKEYHFALRGRDDRTDPTWGKKNLEMYETLPRRKYDFGKPRGFRTGRIGGGKWP